MPFHCTIKVFLHDWTGDPPHSGHMPFHCTIKVFLQVCRHTETVTSRNNTRKHGDKGCVCMTVCAVLWGGLWVHLQPDHLQPPAVPVSACHPDPYPRYWCHPVGHIQVRRPEVGHCVVVPASVDHPLPHLWFCCHPGEWKIDEICLMSNQSVFNHLLYLCCIHATHILFPGTNVTQSGTSRCERQLQKLAKNHSCRCVCVCVWILHTFGVAWIVLNTWLLSWSLNSRNGDNEDGSIDTT